MKNTNEKYEDTTILVYSTIICAALLCAFLAVNNFFMAFYGYQIQEEGYRFQNHISGFMYELRVMAGIIPAILSFFIFLHAFKDLQFNKPVKIMAGFVSFILILSMISVFLFTPYQNKNIQIDTFSSLTYEYLIKNNVNYENSTHGKEFKSAIQSKNYEKIKYLVKNPDDYQGLSVDSAFEKLMIVQGINNQKIRNYFNEIYSDKYITYSEYNEFKKKASEIIAAELSDDHDGIINYDKDQYNISRL